MKTYFKHSQTSSFTFCKTEGKLLLVGEKFIKKDLTHKMSEADSHVLDLETTF